MDEQTVQQPNEATNNGELNAAEKWWTWIHQQIQLCLMKDSLHWPASTKPMLHL
jgi:hypothetical protein